MVQALITGHLGFLVLGVDYFFGDPVYKHTEPDFDRSAWMEKARTRAAQETPRWIQAVREKYGTDKQYAAVGYCFGGPYVMNMAGTDQVVAGESNGRHAPMYRGLER